MTSRELLREVAAELEAVQVIRGRADPRAAFLRALAARFDEEEAYTVTLAADGEVVRAGARAGVLARLDAPLVVDTPKETP